MGKRQLGELQPFEFAITIVAAELACIPMSDPTIPLIYGIIPIFTLFLMHILINKIAVKSVKFRRILNGKPSVVIFQGNILCDTFKDLDMTTNDLLEALRCAGYFTPGEVGCAVVETNGTLTVMPKAANRPVTCSDLNINCADSCMPVTVIVEGRFLEDNLKHNDCKIEKQDIMQLLENLGLSQKDVFLLLLSGENVFLQPYQGSAINRSIKEAEQ